MSAGGKCKPCPKGADCPKGSTYRTLKIKKGYFRYSESSKVYTCPLKDQCTDNVTQPCKKGSSGPLCSICNAPGEGNPGYWKTATGACEKCKERPLQAFAILAATIILAGALSVVILVKYRKIIPATWINRISYSLAGKGALFRKLLSPEFFSRGKIVWTAYQILSATKRTMPGLKFPLAFQKMRRFFDVVVNLELAEMPVACIIDGEYNIYWVLLFKTLLPVFIFIVISLLLAAYNYFRPRPPGTPRTITATLVGLFIAFLALPSVSETVFSIWHCTNFKRNDVDVEGNNANIIRRLVVDHSISCIENDVLVNWQVYASIMMLSPLGGPLGTPLLCFWLLWKHRDRISDPPGDTDVIQLWNRRQDKGLSSISFIFESYSVQFWWYETFDIFRRVILTGGLVLIPEYHLNLRYFAAVVLSFCSIILHESTRPYRDFFTNTLALGSHIAIFAVFLVALQIHVKVFPPTFLLALVLVSVLLLPLSSFVYFQYHEKERLLKKHLKDAEELVQKEELRTQVRHLLANSDRLAEQVSVESGGDVTGHASSRWLSVFAAGSPMKQPGWQANPMLKDRKALKNSLPKFDEKGSCT